MAFPKLDDVIQGVVANANEGESLAQSPDQAPIPDQAPDRSTEVNQAPEPTTPQEQQILDLKELVKENKFKFGDKEYTLSELEKSIMKDADYRRKTQEISSIKKEHESLKNEQKYWENLQYDLAALKANPNLINEFKKTYPEKFHSYAKEFEPEPTFDENYLMSKVQSLLQKEINPLRESITEREKAATIAEWNAWDTQLKSKYSLAQPEYVEALLNKAISEGHSPNKDLWEQVYKIGHEKMEGLKKQWQSENFQQTKTLNQSAKEPKAGGSIPGQAPEKVSLKDAYSKMLEAIGG